MSRSRAALLLTVLGIAVPFAAGCGGGGGGGGTTTTSESTTTTSTSTESTESAADWANGFCGAFKDWANALKPIGQSLQTTPTKENLQSSADDIKSANETLANDLKGLGRPDISGADEVKSAINTLAGQIKTASDTISSALSNISNATEIVAAASALSTTLLALQSQIKNTVTQLKQIDASGDGSLKSALTSASNCQSLNS
jgi:hypothetical protein